ncbi:hypothetical protein BVJ60_17395 [Vibrio cholerae]|uniref:hypothetical protein n=1 Tax=Vibrio cholerae TaxID=666 RepID=UPI00096B82CD|nr:hypothetical protein [Vibrio cholerae]MBO1386538.1 hypothetical protein [Vibrio cholerae]WOQ88831.1 hypothetical protein R4535_06945 [Vibrio cholerae]
MKLTSNLMALSIFILKIISLNIAIASDVIEETSSVRLDSLYQKIDSEKNFADIRVYNDSSELSFVSVSVLEILNPGEKVENFKNPEFGRGPILSSKAIVIPSGSSKSIRVYYPEEIERVEDRFFRIRFSPVLPSKEYGFTEDEINSAKENLSSKVNVSIGWGHLLVVGKQNPKLAYEAKIIENNTFISLENTGDSLLTFKSILACSKDKECSVIAKGTRLIKKHTKKVKLSDELLKSKKIDHIEIIVDKLDPRVLEF